MTVAYATVDEVKGVLARDVADATGTAATLFNPDMVDYHIASAQAEIDARLAGRYVVPFPAPVPSLIKALTVDVAAYLATLTYRQSVDVSADDPVRLRYQRAQDMFKAIADGSMDLPAQQVPGDGGASTAGIATVRNPYRGTLFVLDDFSLGYSSYDNRVRGDWRGW